MKKVLAKTFVELAKDKDEKYLAGTGERRSYLLNRENGKIMKEFKFGAKIYFNEKGDKVLLSQQDGKFAVYDIKNDTMILEQKLPGKHKEEPFTPCLFYNDNTLLFGLCEATREGKYLLLRYSISENVFEIIEQSSEAYFFAGKIENFYLCFQYIYVKEQSKIKLIKFDESANSEEKIMDTDSDYMCLYNNNLYYLIETRKNLYEIYCMDKSFTERKIGEIRKKRNFSVSNLCVSDQYLGFIYRYYDCWKEEYFSLYNISTLEENGEELCPEFATDLLLTKDTLYIGAMDALYCCELDRHSDDAN